MESGKKKGTYSWTWIFRVKFKIIRITNLSNTKNKNEKYHYYDPNP